MANNSRKHITSCILREVPAHYTATAVYDEDDRREIIDIQSQDILRNSKSTFGAVRKSDCHVLEDGSLVLPSRTLAQRMALANMPLCQSEPYLGQQSPILFTAFLVSGDLLVTAGHCIEQASVDDIALIADFKIAANGLEPLIIPPNNVFTISEILLHKTSPQNEDFALCRLNRPVVGRLPLPLDIRETPEVGEEVYMIGHPLGLPLKVADNAEIGKVEGMLFTCNLDAFGKNSGSPIILKESHTVAGILIRGASDFTKSNNCFVSAKYSSETHAEICISIHEIAQYMYQLGNS